MPPAKRKAKRSGPAANRGSQRSADVTVKALPSPGKETLIRYAPLTREQLASKVEIEIEVPDWTGKHREYQEHCKRLKVEAMSHHERNTRRSISIPAAPSIAKTSANAGPSVNTHKNHDSSPIVPSSKAVPNADKGVLRALVLTPFSSDEDESRAASAAPDLASRLDSPMRLIASPSAPSPSPTAGPATKTTVPSVSRQASYDSLFSGPDDTTGAGAGASSPPAPAYTSLASSDKWIDLQERDWARDSASPPASSRPQFTTQEGKAKGKEARNIESSGSGSSDDSEAQARREAERKRRIKEKKRQRQQEEEERENQRRASKAKKKKTKKDKGKNTKSSSTSRSKSLKEDDEVDDLRSNINADAFSRSTAPSVRKNFAAHLKKLQKARKGITSDSEDEKESQGNESDGSSSDSSDSDSDGSSDSSAFVVDDNEIIHETGRVSRVKNTARAQKQRSPMAFSSIIPLRLTLEDACGQYIRWIALQILESATKIPTAQQDDLARARRFLQQHVEDSRRCLSSSVMRRQFMWYLNHYPTLDRRLLFSSEIQLHRGCSACHRSKQKCDSELTFSGRLYDRKTLMLLEPNEEDDLSSDMSSNAEDAVEHRSGQDATITFKRRFSRKRKGRTVHVFFCGSFCATRAVLLHSLTHWEHQTLSKVFKTDEMKGIHARHSKGGHIGERDLEVIVGHHAERLRHTLLSYRRQAIEIAKK